MSYRHVQSIQLLKTPFIHIPDLCNPAAIFQSSSARARCDSPTGIECASFHSRRIQCHYPSRFSLQSVMLLHKFSSTTNKINASIMTMSI